MSRRNLADPDGVDSVFAVVEIMAESDLIGAILAFMDVPGLEGMVNHRDGPKAKRRRR